MTAMCNLVSFFFSSFIFISNDIYATEKVQGCGKLYCDRYSVCILQRNDELEPNGFYVIYLRWVRYVQSIRDAVHTKQSLVCARRKLNLTFIVTFRCTLFN